MTAIRAAVRSRRQDFAGGTELARRSLPEDPQQRAEMTAARVTAITGCQHQVVTCWRCLSDVDISDAWPAGREFECTNEQKCTERAAGRDDEEFAYEAARGRGDNGGI